MRLSTNFKLNEFYNPIDHGTTWRSRTWAQRVITARPTPPAPELVAILQLIRDTVNRPVRITSGVRSEARNRAVGGSNSSGHMSGSSADIQVISMPRMRDIPPREVGTIIRDLFNRGLLQNLAFSYIGGSFVHIGVDSEVPRNSIWGAGY